jgi:ACS family hexuronate transporter-like MFS transporter
VVTRRYAWLVAIVATLTMTVSYIDRNTLAVLAPTVTKALGISNEAYGWIGSAFSMAYLIGTPLAGWWIDRAGARRGLVVSVLVWSVVAALHALVPGFTTLFVLRFALGLAEAPSFPGASQTVQRILPPRDRERGFGVLFTGSSIGSTVVPILAVFLFTQATPRFGADAWRIAMLGTTAAGLIWIPAWLAVTRSPAVRAQLAALPVDPSVPRIPFGRLVRSRVMLRALAGVVASAPVFNFPTVWGAKYLTATYGLKQEQLGHYLWLPALLFDVGAILFGDLASRQRRPEGVPPRSLYAVGVALAAALAFLPLAGGPWDGILILGAASIGAGAMYALTTSDLLARVPVGSVSLASGTVAGAQSLALIICNPLIGRAVDHLHSYDAVALGLGLWVLPGGLFWLLCKPPYPPPIEVPTARARRA